MSTSSARFDHEVRPNLETGIERATTRFEEAVSLAHQLAAAELSWSRLGRLLTIMERDGDFKRLGFKTINSCIEKIVELSGYKRASIYAFKKLYEEANANGADVPEMPLGSAHVFKNLPKHLQSDPEIIEAVKTSKPKQFRKKIATEHPECHIEETEDIELHLESSFVPIFHEVLDSMRVLEEQPNLSYERAVELMCIAWMNEPWGEPELGITNLQRARQLRELVQCP